MGSVFFRLWSLAFMLLSCRGGAANEEGGGGKVLDRVKAYDLYVEGNEYYGAGDLDRAAETYLRALEYDETHADSLCNLGSVYQDIGGVYEGESMYEDARLYYLAALEYYKKAVESNPYHAVAHFNAALLLHEADPDSAIGHYQAAIESDPTMADVWANMGSALHQQKELESAMHAYQEAIELFYEDDPEMELYGHYVADIHYKLGSVLSQLDDDMCASGTCTDHAIEQFRKSLRLVPENPMAEHHLAALLDNNLSGASAEYVAALFDDYAHTFDESLAALNYKAPEILQTELMKIKKSYGTVYDAGCGTGLMGALLAGSCDRLIGSDLSSGMVDRARERGLYHELVVGDVVHDMTARHERGEKAEAIVAADVLVYIGDLDAFLESSSKYIEAGGVLAFTLESCEEGECDESRGFKLRRSGRFAHVPEYVDEISARHGFGALSPPADVTLRTEGGKPVRGRAYLLTRSSYEGSGDEL